MMRPLLLMVIVLSTACRAPAPPTPTPDLAPNFSLTALDGSTYSLVGLRGRWIIVNFWATWCAPCVEEMPVLDQIAAENEDNLTVLGVNMREDKAEVHAFASAHQLRFPILLNPYDEMLTTYTVTGLPQTLIIDPRGELVYRSFGPLDLESFGALLNDLMRVDVQGAAQVTG